MTGQPTPTHTHIWDGGDLPDWLTGHHRWHDDQLVIRTPDGDTRPHAGWWLIAWSDGTVTAASPTSGARVYGEGGITDRLERAEHELNQYTEAESADAAAGSYAGRVEELEAEQERLRVRLGSALACMRLLKIYADGLDHGHPDDIGPLVAARIRRILAGLDDSPANDTQPARRVHVTITNPDEFTANRSALCITDFLRAEFPFVHVTTDAREWEQPGPAEEARLAQSGIDTPGCDCGHTGMGVSWHSDDCPWRRSKVDPTA